MQNIFNIEQIISQIKEMPTLTPLINGITPMHFYMHMKQDLTKTNSTNFNKINIGSNDLLQTSSSSLYENLDGNLNVKDFIGNESSNVTIYNYNIHNTDKLYESFVQSVFRLNNLGTIGISHTHKLQHFDDYYALPNNTIRIAPIVIGTGNYINKRGIVGIVSSATSSLKLIIIFLYNT